MKSTKRQAFLPPLIVLFVGLVVAITGLYIGLDTKFLYIKPMPSVTPSLFLPMTPIVTIQTNSNNEVSVQEQLAQIDTVLRQTTNASVAYNAPQTMNVDETVTIDLLVNPSLPPNQLASQVTGKGTVTSATIDITPQMKAILVAADSSAFTIQPIQDNPEQLISSTETTNWLWLVTAKKAGLQIMTLTIYRLVKYEGQDYWREVETYTKSIKVKVTLLQQFKSLDWEWIVGGIVALLLVPLFWRIYDKRHKSNAPKYGGE